MRFSNGILSNPFSLNQERWAVKYSLNPSIQGWYNKT
jgi:hypothetical protein